MHSFKIGFFIMGISLASLIATTIFLFYQNSQMSIQMTQFEQLIHAQSNQIQAQHKKLQNQNAMIKEVIKSGKITVKQDTAL